MLYNLEQGATEENILRQCSQFNLPIPDAIANAPVLTEGLELYFMAFLDLTSCRNYGMSEGPIPWTAVKEWIEFHGLSVEQAEDLCYHIKEMDSVYLKYMAKKRDKK